MWRTDICFNGHEFFLPFFVHIMREGCLFKKYDFLENFPPPHFGNFPKVHQFFKRQPSLRCGHTYFQNKSMLHIERTEIKMKWKTSLRASKLHLFEPCPPSDQPTRLKSKTELVEIWNRVIIGSNLALR